MSDVLLFQLIFLCAFNLDLNPLHTQQCCIECLIGKECAPVGAEFRLVVKSTTHPFRLGTEIEQLHLYTVHRSTPLVRVIGTYNLTNQQAIVSTDAPFQHALKTVRTHEDKGCPVCLGIWVQKRRQEQLVTV